MIVIVVDTLRADHLGLYGYDRPTSPNLDGWASEGRVYEHAFATAPWTLPSFGSLYTGRWPTHHRAGVAKGLNRYGNTVPNALVPTVETVAESFARSGFVTGAVLNNPFLDASFGVDRGFDVYDHVPGDNQDIRRADVMVDRALAMIDRWHGHPFFLVLHLFDPHLDYDPPAAIRGTFSSGLESSLRLPVDDLPGIRDGAERLSASDKDFVRAAYDEEILFVDQELGRFRDALEARDILHEALIVLTSDHGEELFDHGGFEHGHAMWQELVHVPLVVWGPGIDPGREEKPVSLVDLMPTMLDRSGIEPPLDLDGLSLWPNLSDGTAIPDRTLYIEGRLYGPPETTVVQWPYKLTLDQDAEVVSAYDLTSNPREWALASAGDPALVTVTHQLADRLRARRRETEPAATQALSQPATPGEEVLDRLRALGYVR